MRIFLATLATPTYTSELYEFSIRDMAELYETRAFLSEDDAIAWAQTEIGLANAQIGLEIDAGDEMPFEQVFDHHDTTLVGANTVEARFVYWNQKGDIEDGNTDDSFCLRIWPQDV